MSDFQNNGGNGAPTVNIIQTKKSNGLGTAGFVLALIGLIFCWVPILGWIVWFLGLLFSFIGVFSVPRGLSIAGLIVSLIDIIVLALVLGAIKAAATGSLF